MKIELLHAGVYTTPQTTAYTERSASIVFIFSGLDYLQTPQIQITGSETGILLHGPQTPIRFRFRAPRENYVLQLAGNIITQTPDNGFINLHIEDYPSIRTPMFTPIPQERLQPWRLEMERIRTGMLIRDPKGRARTLLGIMNLFRKVIDAESGTSLPPSSPADIFKQRIDQDRQYTRALNEIADDCRYSPDHLRLLFQARFGISPKQYRKRRQMADAMDLIAGSNLSIKEIAAQLGFRHLSHFSAAFKTAYRIPPRAAIKRFRGQPPE